jgi:putative FmdB family regulatory protein
VPLYLYECPACTERFEELVLGSEAVACPRCGGDEPRKLPSRASVGGTARPAPTAGPCGTCGDPRGPGACDL